MASSKVKASERIRLSSGQVMTLGEALDAGFLVLKETTSYSRTKEDSRGRALAMTHYTARETNGDFYWEIGRTLYESRSGLPVSAGGGSRLEPNVRKGFRLSHNEWLMTRKAWREAAEAQAIEWAAEALPGERWDAVTSRVFNRRLDKLDNFLRFFFRAEYELNPVLFDSYDGAALVILPRAAGLRLARRLFGGGPGISGDLQKEDLSWNMDWFRPRGFH